MRRSWAVWGGDSSKQALGAFLAHGANMLISYLWAGGAEDNECLFYLVNFVMDCVFGLIFNIALLKLSTYIAEEYFESDALTSGFYGEPFEWSRWAVQTGAWLGVVAVAKVLLVFTLVFPLKGPLYRLVDVLFAPLAKYPELELLLVMVVIPLVLNTATFWISDHYLMLPLKEANSGMVAKDNFDDLDADVIAAVRELERSTYDDGTVGGRPRVNGYRLV